MNKECVFYQGKKCAALNQKKCGGCRFFKTEEQLEEGRKRAKDRVMSLPLEQRLHIASVYYGKLEEE